MHLSVSTYVSSSQYLPITAVFYSYLSDFKFSAVNFRYPDDRDGKARGDEENGPERGPVPWQTIRREFYGLLDKRGVLGGDFFGRPGRKKANHWPGMHPKHSWTV